MRSDCSTPPSPHAARHDRRDRRRRGDDQRSSRPPTPEPRRRCRSRACTPGRSGSRSASRATSGQRRRAMRILFLRSRHGQDPSQLPLGRRRGHRRRAARSPIPPSSSPTTRPTAHRPTSWRAANARARPPEGSPATPSTATARSPRSPSPGGCSCATSISARPRELPVGGPVFDPRPDPGGQRVAYVSGRTLRVAELDGSWRVLAGDDDEPETVTWGSADFIAAEEMRRHRGYWWSPDGSTIAATRVDTAPVALGVDRRSGAAVDAASTTFATRSPGPPTPRCRCTSSASTGRVVDVEWDRSGFPYLAEVHWSAAGMIVVDRVALAAGRSRSSTSTPQPARPSCASPTATIAGSSSSPARRACGPTASSSRAPTATAPAGCSSTASRSRRPTSRCVRSWPPTAAASCSSPTRSTTPPSPTCGATTTTGLAALTDEPGVHTAAAAGGTVVIRTATLDEPLASWDTLDGVELQSFAADAEPGAQRLDPLPRQPPAGDDGAAARTTTTARRCPCCSIRTAVPHALRSLRSHLPHLVSRSGSPTRASPSSSSTAGERPGRGSEWERAIHGDLATAALEDQIDALEQAAAELGCLDLDRVAIRGWSFGGYLAALAVLLRPDRVHAAIAGAPVTEWRLYDTHYTERYLGDPNRAARRLRRFVAAAPRRRADPAAAADPRARRRQRLRRPHAAAVVALLAAGRPHEVLPAGRRHPHDAPGGRRREPAPPPARLPAPIARSRQLT